jgi:hypothetical protein
LERKECGKSRERQVCVGRVWEFSERTGYEKVWEGRMRKVFRRAEGGK